MMNISRRGFRLAAFASVVVLLAACVSSGGGKKLAGDGETEAEKAATVNKQLGTVYLRQGNLALAKEKLERAEKYNPRDAELHSVLALLYERLGNSDEVDKHYRTAVRLAPKDPQVMNNYAVYLCKNDRMNEGVKLFLQVARNPLYRTPELAYTNAGVCMRKVKRLDEASQSFKRALSIRPNLPEAAVQLADLSIEQGNVEQAREQVDKYLAKYDATPDMLMMGVRVTRELGDRVAEEKYTRRLRVEFPESPQLRALNESRRNPG